MYELELSNLKVNIFRDAVVAGVFSFVFGLFVHVWIWRFKLVEHSRSNLMKVLLLSGAFFFGVGAVFLNWSYLSLVGGFLILLPLTLSYIITYSAMEFRSPTLLLIHHLSVAPHGLTEDQMCRLLLFESPLKVRLAEMVRDGTLKQMNDGNYVFRNCFY